MAPSAAFSTQQQQQQQPHPPIDPTPSLVSPTALPKPSSIVSPNKPAGQPPSHPGRNIEKVVFGSLCFRTWYPSYYNKELLGDGPGKGGKDSSAPADDAAASTAPPRGPSSSSFSSSSFSASSKHRTEPPPVLERLYICPSCFKYARELVAWRGHVRVCERRGRVPGRKIYAHPRGRWRTVLVPAGTGATAAAAGQKRRKGEGGVRYVEDTVRDEGEWSIWEVDGDDERLFCQNLSLFGKLFLDNKSIFFDTTGFSFFLLVYTPPPAASPSASEKDDPSPSSPLLGVGEARGSETHPQGRPVPQITGFFSKEKMSWDHNNLACILVFPPWQRKGLGALLMAASYEISRREGVMGGPEKPISELGLRGYKRFWSGEIARWLLGREPSTEAAGETIVDIHDLSRATWIWPEDCLFTLREMGVYEDIGLGPGKGPAVADVDGEEEEEEMEMEDDGEVEGEGGEAGRKVEMVNRVRIDLDSVRRFVSTNGISLERMCDPDGFVEGYAVKDEDEEE